MKKIIIYTLIGSAIFGGSLNSVWAQWTTSNANVYLVDKNDDGNITYTTEVQKGSRVYGYYYPTNSDNYSTDTINNFEFKVPDDMCMTAEWLPTILPIKSQGIPGWIRAIIKPTKETLIEGTLIRDHKNLNNIEKIHNAGNAFKWHIFTDWKISFTKSDSKSPFYYSEDGINWESYTSRNDPNIPDGCIKYIKYNAYNYFEHVTILTYNMVVNSDKVNTLVMPPIQWNNSPELNLINTENICTELPIHINIEEKKKEEKKPEEQKEETKPTPSQPRPQVPTNTSTSGPGGYTTIIPSTTTPVISTAPTVPITPMKSPVLEIKKEEKQEEKKDFSISFVDTKNEIVEKLPTITPKMGTTFSDPSTKAWMEKLKLIETRLPTRDLRLARSKDTNIDFWKQVLPEVDKNRDEYIVIPSRGLVIPVTHVDENSSSYQSFISGNNEDFVKESYHGSVMMPGSEKRNYGESGNKIIGGHSSWWRNTDNRYKTHFQTLIDLPQNTEIWTYKKDTETGKYIRYIYKTVESYNTSDTDVSILKNTPEKSLLTLFTCTPIGGDVGRWVVKAEFIGKE